MTDHLIFDPGSVQKYGFTSFVQISLLPFLILCKFY